MHVFPDFYDILVEQHDH